MKINEEILKKRGLLEYLKEEKELLKSKKKPFIKEMRDMFCREPCSVNLVMVQRILKELKEIEKEINELDKEINSLKEELGI